MAKRQRVKSEPMVGAAERRLLDPTLIASGLLGAAVVYLAYHPSDAALVESGDALWFCLLSLATCLFTFVVGSSVEFGADQSSSDRLSHWLDVAVWMLALWIMFAAFANAGVSNLRMGTNEAWIWISGAALFTSVRRLASRPNVRRCLLLLTVLCATGLSVHALHQELVTLPMNRLEFERDPEGVLIDAGVDAPQFSAERAVFAGRLYGGGPTATFALANSLAAILMAGVLLSACVTIYTWNSLSRFQCVAWMLVTVVCFAGLVATRSRSALVATAIGLLLIGVLGPRGPVTNRKLWLRVGGFTFSVLAAFFGLALDWQQTIAVVVTCFLGISFSVLVRDAADGMGSALVRCRSRQLSIGL